ncbi:hypothetical protein EB796_000315 [Bugula neritina]|uniref:Uncharacterized protein n=1 Tax=Bugula neritina TaxID=10212 RepID=A0A7J7KT23_BUGNE|nr:hypothetical protein EB796_000315 [Bugula neritina]
MLLSERPRPSHYILMLLNVYYYATIYIIRYYYVYSYTNNPSLIHLDTRTHIPVPLVDILQHSFLSQLLALVTYVHSDVVFPLYSCYKYILKLSPHVK